jgi:hypothetical protein
VSTVRNWIWMGVGLVLLAFLLMEFVKSIIPVLVVAIVLYVIYSVMFRRRI